MSKTKKLEGGGNTVILSSGDAGYYIDLTAEDLRSLVDSEQRELPHNKTGIRIFVSPSKLERGYYKHYLTIAQNV